MSLKCIVMIIDMKIFFILFTAQTFIVNCAVFSEGGDNQTIECLQNIKDICQEIPAFNI